MCFDEALNKLEIINKKLERNKVPLEKAIELYQYGIELIEHCDEKLDEAEGKIEKISDDGQEIEFDI